MNVADMWACLQGHHTDNHWRHVAGWRKIAELSGQHLGRLRTYRERLAQAWPPETNAASHAYLVKLDELIEQVQRTHDAAATNQTALSAATLALSSSRDKIEKIHQEYADKLQQKRSWEQTAADPKAAAASRAIQSPVTDSDLEQLNTQARNIMYGLSTELQQAQTQLRHPPPTARPVVQANDPDVYATSIHVPVIPRIAPIPASTTAPHATRSIRSPSDETKVRRTIGPILGSAIPGSTAESSSLPINSSAATPSSHSTTTANIPASPLSRSPFTTPENGRSNQSHSDRRSSMTEGPKSGRPIPTGGLIGESPATRAGYPTPSDTSPTRINPFGGLIGGGAAGTAPAGGAGSRPGGARGLGVGGTFFPPPNGSPPGALNVTGRGEWPGPSTRSDLGSTSRRRWDADDPWATPKGVAPVVMPPDDTGPIDPGPAIGLDR